MSAANPSSSQEDSLPAGLAPDRLTQLQTALDQFTIQCYSTIHYINNHHEILLPNAYVGPPPAIAPEDPQPMQYDGSERGGPDNRRLARPEDLVGVSSDVDTRGWVAFPQQPAQDPPEGETWKGEDPVVFKKRQAELAKDLVLKSKQIEMLILSLPGVGVSEEDQERRLKGLEERLKKGEAEREKSVKAREDAREKLDNLLGGIRRV